MEDMVDTECEPSASDDACRTSDDSGVTLTLGNLYDIAAAKRMPSAHIVWFGMPMTPHILSNMSASDEPGKEWGRGLRERAVEQLEVCGKW